MTQSKWHVSEDFWPKDKMYPWFCVGAGYFMPPKAYNCAAKLIQSPSHKYFPREDVSGGIMMEKCRIRAVTLPNIYPEDPPELYRYFLIQHYVKKPDDVHKLWKEVLHHNKHG